MATATKLTKRQRLAAVKRIMLRSGSHSAPSNGVKEACVMEAVAYVAGEQWSDHPECASPVITAFMVAWNDSLNDEDRQMLKPYIPKLIGTRTNAKDEKKRAWMATDWLARECAPAWLRLAGLTDHAELLERLAPLTSDTRARKAQDKLSAAESAARSAARSELQRTVKALQKSALLLLDRMIEVGK